MKELIDDSQVPARGYYFLLDWNEVDKWKTISKLFNTNRLCDLELHQYLQLFEIAMKSDLENMKKNQK